MLVVIEYYNLQLCDDGKCELTKTSIPSAILYDIFNTVEIIQASY